MTKVALITGSSKGIGADIARGFGAAGFHVVVTHRQSEAEGNAVVKDIEAAGGAATLMQVDVRDESSVQALFDGVDEGFGQLDVLISNAVADVIKPIDEASLDEWHVPLLTKLDGAFLCTKYALPLLQKSDNPSITYITSIDGERPNGDYIGYQVGTAGLVAMTKANAVFLGRKYKIRVNAVAPGPTRTDLWGPDLTNEAMWQKFEAKSPMGRVGTGAETAEACLYLAQDESRFLNGVFLDTDGGSRWSD